MGVENFSFRKVADEDELDLPRFPKHLVIRFVHTDEHFVVGMRNDEFRFFGLVVKMCPVVVFAKKFASPEWS